MHPLYTAGDAACEEPVHATCMRCGGQVLPCRRQGLRACRMHPLLMAGDRRRRGTSTGHEACGWHALWLSGAASGAASAHAACIHRCGCRRATGARRLHPLFIDHRIDSSARSKSWVPGLPGLGREAAASPSTGVEESQGVLTAPRPVGLGMCAPDVIMGGAFTA